MSKDRNIISPSILKDIQKKMDGNRSDLANVVDTLLNDKWRRRKTRLHGNIITPISIIDTLAQIWDIKFLKLFVDDYTEYLTSKEGKGRQEIVDITKYTIDKETNARKEMMDMLGRR